MIEGSHIKQSALFISVVYTKQIECISVNGWIFQGNSGCFRCCVMCQCFAIANDCIQSNTYLITTFQINATIMQIIAHGYSSLHRSTVH